MFFGCEESEKKVNPPVDINSIEYLKDLHHSFSDNSNFQCTEVPFAPENKERDEKFILKTCVSNNQFRSFQYISIVGDGALCTCYYFYGKRIICHEDLYETGTYKEREIVYYSDKLMPIVGIKTIEDDYADSVVTEPITDLSKYTLGQYYETSLQSIP